MTQNRHIIIYDGVCNFCNWSVNFVIRRDASAKFCFVPMQSELAVKLAQEYKIDNIGMDKLLLIKEGETYVWSNASLEIAGELDGYWYLFKVFKIIPSPIRDWFYRLFGKYRYTLFGRREQCMVPNEEVRARFLNSGEGS